MLYLICLSLTFWLLVIAVPFPAGRNHLAFSLIKLLSLPTPPDYRVSLCPSAGLCFIIQFILIDRGDVSSFTFQVSPTSPFWLFAENYGRNEKGFAEPRGDFTSQQDSGNGRGRGLCHAAPLQEQSCYAQENPGCCWAWARIGWDKSKALCFKERNRF